MKNLFNSFRDIIKGNSPLMIFIGLIALFTLIIAVIIIFRGFILTLIPLAALVIWKYHDMKENRKIQEAALQAQEFNIVYECMYYVLSKLSKRLNIEQPVDVNSIIPANPIITIGDIHTFICRVLKNDSKPVDENELKVHKAILQNNVNTTCATGVLGLIPQISILNVCDTRAYLQIEVAIITNQAIYNYVLNRDYQEKQIEDNLNKPVISASVQKEQKIPIAYNKELLDEGLNKQECIVGIPISRFVHSLVIGSTGSGKTTFLKLLIVSILKYIRDAELWVLDFKNDDFKFMDGYDKYYKFDECLKGLDEFYMILKNRQNGTDQSKTPKILLIDEFAALISSITDKKVADAEKSKLNELLMLGRSFQLKVICGAQRGDSSYFGAGGARDNFQMIVALGSISKESRDMFFSDFKEKILPDRTTGTGYLLIGNSKLVSIQVPNVGNMSRLEADIKRVINTQAPPIPAGEA